MDMDTSEDPWTVDEDLTLINYIDAHGEGRRWNSLARSAGLKRTGKSCRLRWFNYLRPKVRRAKKQGPQPPSCSKMRMPDLLTLEDFKDKELDPKSTPLEVLAFVGKSLYKS
ncbi:hypothetical protein K1719_046019 [Acacia pycnantha]|nr:hypothetical protein K1719_046019 [Acacia pycnantha]